MNLDPNTSDRESHKQVDAEHGRRVISLLSFLKAENIKLQQAVMELSLDTMALREALKRMEAPRHVYRSKNRLRMPSQVSCRLPTT